MKLENVKVGMKVFVKAKQCGVGHTESDSLNREGTVADIDDSDSVYTLKVDFGDFDIDWMNHKQVKQIGKPLSIDTIKVGMKVRTLEGTLTDKFRFPVGTEFTVTSIGGDEKHVSLKHGSGTTQTDRIEYLTKSW